MANSRRESVKCPSCGEEGIMEVWDSINTARNPEMKKRVSSREIFTYTCSSCGSRITVAYDFLYHDPEAKYMIFLRPNGGENPFAGMEQVSGVNLSDYRLREVKDINGLLEKIMLFEDGLDDRCIEVCKLYLSEQYANQKKGKKLYGIFYNGQSGDGVMMEFFLFGEEGEMCGTKLPARIYDTVLLKLSGSRWDRGEEYKIDFAWAVHAFEQGLLNTR